MMTLGSLFDGIGGWLLAARHAGVTPIWASEIEPFPCLVTARHFPDVKQLGDIIEIDPDDKTSRYRIPSCAVSHRRSANDCKD